MTTASRRRTRASSTRGDGHARPRHFVLSCMDYRHMDDLVEQLTRTFGCTRDDYDHVVLAGASLGVVQPVHPEWGVTFWKHLEIARRLHEAIETVVLVEHEDCGAYKMMLGERYPSFAHEAMSELVAKRVSALAPELGTRRFIMRRTSSDDEWRLHELAPLTSR